MKTFKSINRYAIFYLLLSAGCLIFSMVYEVFSHGVTSPYMHYLFAIPLLIGFLPCFITEYIKLPAPGRFWHDAVLIFTASSLLRGVMDIYGTSSPYIRISVYVGTIFVILDIALIKYRSNTTSISKRLNELIH